MTASVPSAVAAALVAVAALSPLPASAGDVQGDAYDCQELWVMRNQIYKDRGYCFTSPRAITYFGNGGCTHDSEDAVPLTKFDRSVIDAIRASEKRQSCS